MVFNMDPVACLKVIREHFSMNQPHEAIPYIAALKGWIDSGGFKPSNHDEEEFNIWCEWAGL